MVNSMYDAKEVVISIVRPSSKTKAMVWVYGPDQHDGEERRGEVILMDSRKRDWSGMEDHEVFVILMSWELYLAQSSNTAFYRTRDTFEERINGYREYRSHMRSLAISGKAR